MVSRAIGDNCTNQWYEHLFADVLIRIQDDGVYMNHAKDPNVDSSVDGCCLLQSCIIMHVTLIIYLLD